MSKQTSNKFSPEVRSHAVRLVLDHEHEHPSRWATIVSVSANNKFVLLTDTHLILEPNLYWRARRECRADFGHA